MVAQEPFSLSASRRSAAEASGGVSSNVIHRAAIKAALDVVATPAAVLDFGSGMGDLIPRLRAAFPESSIAGADILDRPPGLAPEVRWIASDLNERLPINGESFDLIMAIEVIEHLENPRHLLRELFRLLRPGGFAVLTTPNTGCIRSLVTFATRGHHAYFDDSNYPAHIMPVSEVDFVRAGREAGFQPHRFFYTDSGMLPKLLQYRWQQLPLVGKHLNGRRFSDNVGVVLAKPGSTPRA